MSFLTACKILFNVTFNGHIAIITTPSMGNWKSIKDILDDEIYNHYTLMQEKIIGDKSFSIFSQTIPSIFST
jgi:hypothetical protein